MHKYISRYQAEKMREILLLMIVVTGILSLIN